MLREKAEYDTTNIEITTEGGVFKEYLLLLVIYMNVHVLSVILRSTEPYLCVLLLYSNP